jgi:hypothetical protein
MPFVWCLGYVILAPNYVFFFQSPLTVLVLALPFSIAMLTIRSSIIGPSLGGALAQPCISYPSVFPPGTWLHGLFSRFPYLLPNLFCTLVVLCGVVIGILFLEETHAEKKHRRDIGLDAGRWILSKFEWCSCASVTRRGARSEKGDLGEVQRLIPSSIDADVEQSRVGYRTLAAQAADATTIIEAHELNSETAIKHQQKPAATKAFTRQVVINIVGYGILA